MTYFVALLAREKKPGSQWQGRDVDVDLISEAESLKEWQVEIARAMDDDDVQALLAIEHEDEWFAFVRMEDDDDPQVFVSDPDAASASPFAEALGVSATDEEWGNDPVGDLDLFADLGIDAVRLRELCEGEQAVSSTETMMAIAEAAGFDETLDSLR